MPHASVSNQTRGLEPLDMSGLYATGVDRDQREEGGKPPLPLKALSVQIFAADDGSRSMANEWVVTHRHRAHHIIDQRLVEQG